jgi:hypothetical protein
MLKLTIPDFEGWDEQNGMFIYVKETQLQLEHSLVSVSKWESKWKKPFISKDKKTQEETIDYIKCMTLTQNVNPLVYSAITPPVLKEIMDYIEDSMTATTFSDKGKAGKEIITSEIIYYWMIANNIPFECQKWHLNRLLTLIKVCSIKNNPGKKMSEREILSRNKALNEARRARLHSKG